MQTKRTPISVIDEYGNKRVIIEIQHFTQFNGLNGTSPPIPTTKEYFTVGGNPLNPINDDRFQDVLTDEILRVA
jgi:hypothetical protein